MQEGKIRVLVWSDHEDENRHPEILDLYPGGFHVYLARTLNEKDSIEAKAAARDDPDYGLPDSLLETTDVLVFYSHLSHHPLPEDIISHLTDRVVNEGMGVIFLHSGIFSDFAMRLIGPGKFNGYREVGERERVWVIDRSHPITRGLPEHFEFGHSEVYGEPGTLPKPDELVFISWFQGGEVSRTGMTWRRGLGKVFYFAPGHLTFDICQQETWKRVVENGIHWAAPDPAQERILPQKVRTPLEPLKE